MTKESLFVFADNKPEDPETKYYRNQIPDTDQSKISDFL